METSERVREAAKRVIAQLRSLSPDELKDRLEERELGAVGKLIHDRAVEIDRGYDLLNKWAVESVSLSFDVGRVLVEGMTVTVSADEDFSGTEEEIGAIAWAA